MIKDNIKNAEIYYSLHPKFKEAFEKLINKDIGLKTKELYFNFDKYQTKSEGKFEAHRQYIDIQYIIGDCLACDEQGLRQFVLGHVFLLPQQLDVLSDVAHLYHLCRYYSRKPLFLSRKGSLQLGKTQKNR